MRRTILGVVIAGVMALLGIAVLAWASVQQVDDPARTNEVLTIPACAFNEYRHDYSFERGTALRVLSSELGPGYFFARVNLPQDARILKAQLVCSDGNESFDVTLELERIWHSENGDGSSESVATVTSSETNNNFVTFTSNARSGKKLVNNWKYAYHVRLSIPRSQLTVQYVRIIYKPKAS